MIFNEFEHWTTAINIKMYQWNNRTELCECSYESYWIWIYVFKEPHHWKMVKEVNGVGKFREKTFKLITF